MKLSVESEYLKSNCDNLTDLQRVALAYYLNYKNNYLTSGKIADDNPIGYVLSDHLILEGKKILEVLNENIN